MNLRRKNIAITALMAALMASGILATANAASVLKIEGEVKVKKDSTTEDSGVQAEKITASGSDASITFNSTISPNDKIIVYVKNQNDNIVSTDKGRWNAVSSGTKKALEYLPNKGKKGNSFYPSFSLDNGSLSSNLTVRFSFQP